jgi:predicted metal-dependent HD superfamily phosphohydrolase
MSPALSHDLRDELLARWSEPHRRHHDGAHLREVLDAVTLLAEHGLVFDRDAVNLAAWFHDAVYDVGRDDKVVTTTRTVPPSWRVTGWRRHLCATRLPVWCW